MRQLLTLALLCAAFAAPAQAQQSGNPRYEPRQPDLWFNAGGIPVEGSQPRFFPGEHGVGGVIAEVDLTPSRFGRLTSDITISDPRHGTLTLTAQTRLRAYANRYIAMGNGTPRVINAGALWCTISETENAICIAGMSAMDMLATLGRPPPPPEQQFRYEEYTPTLSRLTGRSWRGPEPSIEETPPSTETTRRQLVIRAISAAGVSVSMDDVTGAETKPGPAGPSLAFGTLGPNIADFFGHPYSFAAIPGSPERTIVTFTQVFGAPAR